MAEDLVVVHGDGRCLSGRDAVLADVRSAFEKLRISQHVQPEETVVAGAWALGRAGVHNLPDGSALVASIDPTPGTAATPGETPPRLELPGRGAHVVRADLGKLKWSTSARLNVWMPRELSELVEYLESDRIFMTVVDSRPTESLPSDPAKIAMGSR